ncbi:MAG: DUF2807 protein [Gammaproteobacteria bacterium]|nr:DUF2807 protein [Gammaproteobacteria bacterium]
MKVLHNFCLIASLTLVAAAGRAETVTKSVPLTPDIVRVYLNGSHELYLTQGEEEYVKLTTTADLLPRVEARVKGKGLYLGKEGEWRNNDWQSSDPDMKVRFDVQLRHIDSVRLRGSGNANISNLVAGRLKIIQAGSGKITAGTIKADAITVEMAGSGDFQSDSIEATDLEVQINGSGKVDVTRVQAGNVEIAIAGSGDVKLADLTAGQLATEISGSADIDISGRVTKQELEINGSGDYRAADLVSEFADIEIRGSGDVEINVRQNLTAETMRGSELIYYSAPDLAIDISGQGKHRNAGRRGDK